MRLTGNGTTQTGSTATVVVVTHVINDNQGTNQSSDFTHEIGSELWQQVEHVIHLEQPLM